MSTSPTPIAAPLRCPACRKNYRIPSFDPGKRYACPACKGTLVVPASSQPTQVKQAGETDPLEFADRAPHEAHVPRQIPVRLGRYFIDGEIGRGGMGVVYQGRQEHTERVVAIKMLLPGAQAGPDQLRRFRREVRAVAKLKHPGIVAIHEVGEFEDLPFFSMEYIEGESLEERIAERGKLPPQIAATFVRDVALAVHHAHEQGIVHRDLKPANILIEAQTGRTKVTDFGLAKEVDTKASLLSAAGDIMGTPAYMSPEQAEARNDDVDARSDVYALGAILYRALTGRDACHGASLAEMLLWISAIDAIPPHRLFRDIDEELSAIVMKALEKAREDRYAGADALAEDLRRWLEGEPVEARPAGLWKRLRKRAARNPATTRVVLGSAATVVIALVLVVLLVGKKRIEYYAEQLQSRDAAVRRTQVAALAGELAAGTLPAEDRARAASMVLGRLGDDDAGVRAAALHGAADGAKIPELRAAIADEDACAAPFDAALIAATADRELFGRGLRLLEEAEVRWAHRVYRRILAEGDHETHLTVLAALERRPFRSVWEALHRTRISDRACREYAKKSLDAMVARVDLLPYPSDAAGAASKALAGTMSAVDDYNKRLEDVLGDITGGGAADPADAWIQRLSAPDLDGRFQALAELERAPTPKAVPALLAALDDADVEISGGAALALTAAARAPGEPAVPREEVRARLSASAAHVRSGAARVLAAIGDRESVPALLVLLGNERSPSAQTALIETLGLLGDRAAAPPLIGLLAEPGTVGEAAAAALERISGQNHGRDAARWNRWLEGG